MATKIRNLARHNSDCSLLRKHPWRIRLSMKIRKGKTKWTPSLIKTVVQKINENHLSAGSWIEWLGASRRRGMLTNNCMAKMRSLIRLPSRWRLRQKRTLFSRAQLKRRRHGSASSLSSARWIEETFQLTRWIPSTTRSIKVRRLKPCDMSWKRLLLSSRECRILWHPRSTRKRVKLMLVTPSENDEELQ